MPFKSEAQRRFMYSQHPEIAQRWANEGKGHVYGKVPNGKPGTTTADNRPVGSAGQPNGGGKLKKHEANDEKRFSAISRRIEKMNKDRGKTNGSSKGNMKGGY